MKRFFPALLLVFNGCFSCGIASHVQDPDAGLTVYRPAAPSLEDRHTSSSLEQVKPGDWVRYQMSETVIRMGAVRVEGKSLWVEVVEEGNPERVSLRRISFDGRVIAARYQEIPASGPASEVIDQEIFPATDSWRDPPASLKMEEGVLVIDGTPYPMSVYKKVFRDESVGREYEMEEGWSEKIPPLLEGLEKAGLAHRKSPTVTIKFLELGTGYTPSIK